MDVINYLKDPAAYTKRGAKVPRGTLLVGPPGEGKTLIARAVAGEASVPFFSISGSDFVEMFVGVGASRVRDVFDEARRNAPCILFIDEIDAIGKRRSGGLTDGGTDEREGTLNQLLVEMDGFNQSPDPVIIFAATNRKDILDPALLRPGRLDRTATFRKPAMPDRLKLFQYYCRNKALADDVDLEHFARNTFGFSAASVEQVCNEATLLMCRRDESDDAKVTAKDFDDAIIRVTVGAKTKGRIVSEEEKLNVAVHETWHAGAWFVASKGQPIARITIEGAGDSGGHVSLMNDDRFLVTDKFLYANIVMSLAARLGQKAVLDITDTGASSDLKQARQIAWGMVTEYGMSPLGDVSKVEGTEYSPTMLAKIEDEVQKILNKAEAEAKEIIANYRANADAVVKELLIHETLLGPEFERIWKSVPATATAAETTATS
jgi:cell division protease FtsH